MNWRYANSIFSIVLTAILTVVVSCSEEVMPTPYTYSQIFSGKNSKTWQLRSILLWEEGKQDVTFTLPNCIKDDLYIFYANSEKLFEVKNGATKCDSEEADILVSDTWTFINAGATLTITIPILAEFNLPYIVREVDKNDMLLEIFLDFEGTQSYRLAFKSVGEN